MFSGANFLLLAVTGVIVAVLLIVTYRSPILWIIPLLVIAVADRFAQIAFTWVLDAVGVVWNESTAGILSVLVFGAGTNYALLLISRYRDELHRTEDRFEAMARAWVPTIKTVFASAVTVVIGVGCLLLSAVPTTRGLGLASMIGIAIAFLFAMFVLPGALVAFNRWIFWPKVPQVGDETEHRFWNRIGDVVRSRPVVVAAVSLVALALACIGALPDQDRRHPGRPVHRHPGVHLRRRRPRGGFPRPGGHPVHRGHPGCRGRRRRPRGRGRQRHPAGARR
ncbi:MMPL family transporter [Corynebacterium suedekumii]|nr:MMPL family transporter [Corynebacterium suedekumii]